MKTQVEILNSIENYIKGICYPEQPEGLYAPIKYILSLGGKRIRPLLMMMAYNLYKEDCETILPQAIALETYHNFTLLHDDLMDNADMRRGNMTVHKKWDANTAILSGDAMLIMAYRLFVGNENGLSDKSLLMKALDTFNDATLGVCDGQQYDVDFESRDDVKEEEYMEMIRLKTSLLLACALKSVLNWLEQTTKMLHISISSARRWDWLSSCRMICLMCMVIRRCSARRLAVTSFVTRRHTYI